LILEKGYIAGTLRRGALRCPAEREVEADRQMSALTATDGFLRQIVTSQARHPGRQAAFRCNQLQRRSRGHAVDERVQLVHRRE
jgi:hypothetical protein